MTLDDYQDMACDTAIYPNQNEFLGLMYCALKLNGEAGEVADKVGKVMRDEGSALMDARRVDLILELGDVLWYIANLARELGVSLEYVACANIDKLKARKARNTLHGSGDER
jgi:NTP pyrophosphatase (non-canonical NTP hydrolase)